MRLFLAIELPPELAREVRARVEALRADLPRARWLPAENLHLTLAFFGETPGDAVRRVDGAVAPVFAGRAPVRLAWSAVGSFPPGRPPRVLWLGLAPSEALERLQGAAAREAFAALGRAPESRPFHAHLTLGRSRERWTRADAERWAEGFEVAGLAPFEAGSGVLMESVLSPDGARYRVVSRYPLEAAA